MSFFEYNVAFANRVTSNFSMAPKEIYLIHTPIADVIILHYFADLSCSTVEMLKEFKDVKEDYYPLKISNIRQFGLYVSHVSSGLSFRQTCLSTQASRLVVDGVDLLGVTEQVVQT